MSQQQQIHALAAIVEAYVTALDPSGRAASIGTQHLRDGLAIADAMGVKSEAAELVRGLIATLDEMETVH